MTNTPGFHAPTETTPDVEKAFEELREKGLRKEAAKQEINWNVLDNHRKDLELVNLNVQVDLVRQRDAGKLTRRILAEDTASIIEQHLNKIYKGSPDDCDVCLAVRVILTSEGNKLGRAFAGEVGAGFSMITVAYCLYSKLNGKCAMAKQLHSRDRGGLKDLKENTAPSAIRRMAEDLATEIDQDVREILAGEGGQQQQD